MLVLVAVLVGRTHESDDPASIVEEYVQSLQRGDCETAAGYSRVLPLVRKQVHESCREAALDDLHLKSFTVAAVDDDPRRAVPPDAERVVEVRYTSEFTAENEDEVQGEQGTFIVAEFDGEWRIIGIGP